MSKDYSYILGKKFNKLTVIKICGRDKYYHKLFLCRCECGNYINCTIHRLINNNTKSCGCLRDEKFLNRIYIHGQSNTRLMNCWYSMKNRCYLIKTKQFKDYGERGITVCDEWINDFMSFKNWAEENGYTDKLSIDRINNNGNYCPDNCKWSTQKEQANNRRSNILVTIEKETLNISQWCKKLNMSDYQFRKRYL